MMLDDKRQRRVARYGGAISLLLTFSTGCADSAPEQKKPATVAAQQQQPQQCPKLDVQRITEISDIDKENQQEITKVSELEKRLAALQDKLSGALTTNQNQVSVASTGSRVRVRMSNELLFRSGSARISEEGRKTLSQVASVLKDGANKRVEIAGHSDSLPMAIKKYSDNWELSMERARRVGEYLISQGVDPKKMMMAGYADSEPLDQGNTEEARAKNRRVEIFIEPTGSDATSQQ